ncbi:MAG: glycosyltransferase family 4 protein [Saprospiraceae bacterium]|nr:glycosyltransferase family 4 protein [Saprospiraceae bacterium]MBX7180172.1 glycosyltransferase family 4 protein [Saprospiraceae bacterium]MCB0591403.1 glycosyltransferase family 4 protein [Saprospiraceae bacterium]MCO5284462.1 glycosyltransferase family 4 protein [Saprospiraceae bacterium]HMY83390.1 glycosyltransferase family 4 protein [Saprospiraceae bacterium]
MRILFLTDNFPPEVNAPASRTYEHCIEWVRRGVEVTVITCVPNFPQGKVFDNYKNKWRQKETMDGIRVIRVWSYISANEGFGKRILDYVSFGVTSFLHGLFVKTDLIVATSPQFFTAVSGRWLSLCKRKPWVMEVRDLWPESIKAVSAMKSDNMIFSYLEWVEKRLYKSAKKIIVVTDAFRDKIASRGIDKNKISVVKNGVLMEKFKPVEKNRQLLSQLGLEGKFIFGYLGTHGMAHKLDFIVECAAKITDEDIHFLFIGNGAQKENVRNLAVQLRVKNCTFLDSVPKNEIADYISITDVALVNLMKSETFQTVIPSKIFENASMQKPILLGVEGESKSIIEQYDAGICFEPENEAAFLDAVYRLKSDAQLYGKLQEGCKRLALDFDRRKLALRMLEIFNQVT